MHRNGVVSVGIVVGALGLFGGSTGVMAHQGLQHLVPPGAAPPAGANIPDWLLRVRGMGAKERSRILAHADRVGEMRAARVKVEGPRSRSWQSDGVGAVWVGTASREITPPRGCPLAGYGDRLKTVPLLYNPRLDPLYYSKLYRPSEGVADPLLVKAIVIDNGERRVCLVGVDSIGLTQLIYEDVLQAVQPLGLDRDALLIGGSHSHGGGGDAADQFLWWLATADILDFRIYSHVVEEIAGAISDAVADLEPARVGVGHSDAGVGLSRNRRGDPVIDPEIAVIRVDGIDHQPKAVVFNFAVHGTTIGAENMLFTSGCMGQARVELERRLGSDVVAVFLNGAEGDVAPNGQGGTDQWERARIWGEVMADQTEGLYESIPTATEVELAGAHIFVNLPEPFLRPGFFLEPPTPGNVKIPISGLVEQLNTNFSGVRVGDAAFVSMPGEAITQIGLDVKAHGDQIGLPGSFVVGLANGHLGYMTTREEYFQGGYEAGATFFGAGTGEIMVDSASRVLDLLVPPSGSRRD